MVEERSSTWPLLLTASCLLAASIAAPFFVDGLHSNGPMQKPVIEDSGATAGFSAGATAGFSTGATAGLSESATTGLSAGATAGLSSSASDIQRVTTGATAGLSTGATAGLSAGATAGLSSSASDIQGVTASKQTGSDALVQQLPPADVAETVQPEQPEAETIGGPHHEGADQIGGQ